MANITIDTDKMKQVGENVLVNLADGHLIIIVDPTVDLGPSRSGKMNAIGNTGGFTRVNDRIRMNLYVGFYPD